MDKISSTNLLKYRCNHPFVTKRIGAFYSRILALMDTVRFEKIISLGCGEGFDLKYIFTQKSNNMRLSCGLDLDLQALQMAGRSLKLYPFSAICGDLYHLPLRFHHCDLILCLEVLEHLVTPDKALREIAQHAKGHCIFSVPHEPFYSLTRMILFRLNIREMGNHPDHTNRWSRRSFGELIRTHFVVDQIVGSFPWTIVLCHKRGYIRNENVVFP